jgi:hypothetical protein
MNRTLFALLALAVIALAAWYAWLFCSSSPSPAGSDADSAQQAPEARLAIDLYPLYASAGWNKAVAASVSVGTTTLAGAQATSAPLDAGMDPGKVFTAFTDYYDQLLTSRGWQVADDLAAGGHMGGQAGYKNGPGTILVGFHIDYETTPENAPSECPCKVTLSLFSSGATD